MLRMNLIVVSVRYGLQKPPIPLLHIPNTSTSPRRPQAGNQPANQQFNGLQFDSPACRDPTSADRGSHVASSFSKAERSSHLRSSWQRSVGSKAPLQNPALSSRRPKFSVFCRRSSAQKLPTSWIARRTKGHNSERVSGSAAFERIAPHPCHSDSASERWVLRQFRFAAEHGQAMRFSQKVARSSESRAPSHLDVGGVGLPSA